MRIFASIFSLFIFYFGWIDTSLSQDTRGQYPPFLAKSYVNINAGYIHYPYTADLLNQNFAKDVASIKIPHFAARMILGYQFSPSFSAQFSVMRPALWSHYKIRDQYGVVRSHSLWYSEWGWTLKAQFPINDKNSFYGEGGLGLIARNGFQWEGARLIDANYACFLGGAGLQHHFGNKWDMLLSLTYSPGSIRMRQPYTLFASAGLIYRMQKLSDEKAKENEGAYLFPKQVIQIGYASDVTGFGANDLFSVSGKRLGIPIFWRGVVQVEKGGIISYQKNVFHTKKMFSLDWGTSISFWQTQKNHDQFFDIAIYPVLRFWYFRSNAFDLYFDYSAAGPSFISKSELDHADTGEHFTYQDFMGTGTYIGKSKKLNAEIKIQHFSNGNLFTVNPGVDVPLYLNLGYTF